jgi:L-seryl-tRNA(Ser) seleniumtransferase
MARTSRGESTIGGGSLPGETLPTTLLTLDAQHVPCALEELARRLRLHTIPVVARIYRDKLLFDPRTVLEEQDDILIQAIIQVWNA